MDASSHQILLASELGALCSRVHTGLGVEAFLQGLVELVEADGAMLAMRLEDESVAAWTVDLDDARARRLLGGGLEPQGLNLLAREYPVWRLSDAGPLGDPVLDAVEEELLNKLGVERLLRVATRGVVLQLCRFTGREDFGEDPVRVFSLLRRSLAAAFQALRDQPVARDAVLTPQRDSFAPRIDTAALQAWGNCPVPLVLLDNGGLVLAANRAARRKVDVRGSPPTMPQWLSEVVNTRLADLRTHGLPDDASGDYQFVRPAGARRLVRLGLAPVDVGGEPVEGDEQWLLSVEHGGPTLDERIRETVARFSLTPKEAEILDLLAEGLTNRKIADATNIAEASVKYRLKRIMEKTGTANRTDLLATVYSMTPES